MNAVTKQYSEPRQATIKQPRSCVLESMRYMPQLNDALCMVRDILTGAKRQVFASKLCLYKFGDNGSFMVAYENRATREVK